jgi:hypothetical protein
MKNLLLKALPMSLCLSATATYAATAGKIIFTCKQEATAGESDGTDNPDTTHENGIKITAKANGKFKLERFDDWERDEDHIVVDNLDCKFTSSLWTCQKSEESCFLMQKSGQGSFMTYHMRYQNDCGDNGDAAGMSANEYDVENCTLSAHPLRVTTYKDAWDED